MGKWESKRFLRKHRRRKITYFRTETFTLAKWNWCHSSLLEDHGNIFTGSAKKWFGTFNCKNIDSKSNKNKNGQNQKPCKFARKNIENLRDVISWITL